MVVLTEIKIETHKQKFSGNQNQQIVQMEDGEPHKNSQPLFDGRRDFGQEVHCRSRLFLA